MFKHLLVPTDGSAHGIQATRLASALAGAQGEISLLHVADDPAIAALAGIDAASTLVSGAPSGLRLQRRLENEKEGSELLGAAKALLSHPANAHTYVRSGRPADTILDELESPRFSAVVLGSRGLGAFARALLGSVSDSVLRHATKPVTIARGERLERILVAVDGSAPSLRAVDGVRQIAETQQAQGKKVSIVLLYAAPALNDPLGHGNAGLADSLREEAEQGFGPARQRLAGLEVQEEIVFEEPDKAILEESLRRQADLVVLGRSGHQPSKRLPIGSVALRVASEAKASVLVVP